MAVSINLLPQERQEKLREKRNRSLAIGLALVVNGGLIGVMIVMFVITQAQRLALSRLQSDIDAKIEQFKNTENVADMVTLQQNLKSVPELYTKRRILTRFFSVTERAAPRNLNFTQLSVDETGKLSAAGVAGNTRLVTKLVRALEASGRGANFSNVELGNVTSGEGGRVTFTLTLTVSPSVAAVGGQR